MTAFLLGLAAVGGALAAPPIEVDAPPSCSRTSLDAELTSCLTLVPTDAGVSVVLRPRGPGFTAHVELRQSGQLLGTRVLELPRGTCAEAMRAVALAICIALDSAASPLPFPPRSNRTPHDAVRRPRLGRDVVFGPAVSWRSPQGAVSSPPSTAVALGLGPVLSVGLTPDATLGVAAGFSVDGTDWRVDAAVVHVPPSRFTGPPLRDLSGGSLDVSFTGASVAATWRNGPWLLGGWILAGAHAAVQTGFVGDHDAPTALFVALGGRLGAALPLSRGSLPVTLTLHVDVGGAAVRGRYVVETDSGPSVVWSPSVAPVLIGLSLSAELF